MQFSGGILPVRSSERGLDSEIVEAGTYVEMISSHGPVFSTRSFRIAYDTMFHSPGGVSA